MTIPPPIHGEDLNLTAARPHPRPDRARTRPRVRHRLRRLGLGLALAALLLRAGSAAAAREAAPAADPPPGPPPPEVLALLGEDPERQAPVLAAWRADPAAARAALVAALERPEPLPERWRLVSRLVEFGSAEDVPLVLAVRESAQSPWERRIAEGAARALYDPVGPAVGLEAVVQDFSFIQTRPTTPLPDANRGKWMVTAWSLGDLHQDDLPLAVIRQVASLRGKAFDSKDELSEALAKRVRPRDWKPVQERVLAVVEMVPPRVQMEGLARVRLLNPLERPLLLIVALDAWYGRFRDPPGSAWVYLEPNATTTLDLPVAPQGALTRPQMRMDLRLREVDGRVIPGFHKLYLPLQP
jgi:hypothetical protein